MATLLKSKIGYYKCELHYKTVNKFMRYYIFTLYILRQTQHFTFKRLKLEVQPILPYEMQNANLLFK